MFKKLVVTFTSIFTMHICNADYKLASVKDFDISIGGEFGAEAVVRVQNSKYNKIDTGVNAEKPANGIIGKQGITANNKNIALDSDASAHVAIENLKDQNFSYGAHIGIKTTTRNNDAAGKSHLERSYIFLQGQKWGKFELGANEGAARAMIIKGSTVDAGMGSWYRYMTLNTFSPDSKFTTPQVIEDNFLTSPKLILQESLYETNHEAFRKITYYTPKFNGFQFGISYIPDTSNKPNVNNFPYNQNASVKTGEKNAFSGGITWEYNFAKNHNISFALVGETGKTKAAKSNVASTKELGVFHRAQAFSIGTKYVKDKISFALSYGNRGKSGFKKNLTINGTNEAITPKSSYFISAGGAYQICDKSSVSLSYLFTESNKNKLDIITLGANYNIAQGIKTYAELTNIKAKQRRNYNAENATITKGQNFKTMGNTIITGIKIAF